MGKNLDAPFGLDLWGPLLGSQLYAVYTAPTIAFYHGDPVQHGGTSISTPYGWMPIVEDGDVIASGDLLVGVIIAIFDEDMDPVSYIAVDDAGDGSIAGYVMVANHPDQLFIVQEDCDTTPIPATSSEMNANLVPVALNAGNTTTGRSTCEIDSDTALDTATLHVKLLYPHPEDVIPGTSTYHTRWIVKINAHALADNIIGKVTST